MTTARRALLRLAVALTLSMGFALGLASAAEAEHSITVSSSGGGATEQSDGGYRIAFNTQASSTEPCRNWSDAADAQVQTPDGDSSSSAPIERSSSVDPGNANQSSVDFQWVYGVPAGSRVTFSSRVVCDTTNHIGGEGLGSPVEVTVPGDQDTCEGDNNRIESVRTASGRDLGLTGTQLFDGQRIVASESTKILLGDESLLQLSKGDSYEVAKCENTTVIDVLVNKLTKLLSGSQAKFNVSTPRAVTGVRGTEFSVEYEKKKQRTTVKVKSGKVVVRALRGSNKKVVAGKGDTVVQVGKKAPEIVETGGR